MQPASQSLPCCAQSSTERTGENCRAAAAAKGLPLSPPAVPPLIYDRGGARLVLPSTGTGPATLQLDRKLRQPGAAANADGTAEGAGQGPVPVPVAQAMWVAPGGAPSAGCLSLTWRRPVRVMMLLLVLSCCLSGRHFSQLVMCSLCSAARALAAGATSDMC